MIYDLFCALSIVLIFVLFYFHLHAFFPCQVAAVSRSANRWARSLILGLD